MKGFLVVNNLNREGKTGGKTQKLGGNTTAVFAVAEPWRPHPLIVKAATDRSPAFVHITNWTITGRKIITETP